MAPKNSLKHLRTKILCCLKEGAAELEQDDIKKIANSPQFRKFLVRIPPSSAEKLEKILRRAKKPGAGTKEHPIPSNSGFGGQRSFGSGLGSSVLGPHGSSNAPWEATKHRGFNSDSESEDENKDPDQMSAAELELKITRGTAPKILVQRCQQFVPMGEYHWKIGPRMNEVFEIFTRLEFESTKELPLQTLYNRLQVPAQTVESLPQTWEMTQPHEIFLALQTIKTLTEDTKIHRAFGQIQFYDYSSNDMLKSVVDAAYNGVSPKEIRRHLDRSTREYNAGLRWIDIAKSFGSSGAIIMFVLANVSMYSISKKWTQFQVDSFKFIATHVPSIRELARSIGDNALENYCRQGKLLEEIVQRVVEVQGLPMPPKRSGRMNPEDDEDRDMGSDDS